jgi:hypothetical protein
MNKIHHKRFNIREIRTRAAEVREQWSPMEKKVRRSALPPDMPWDLRCFIVRQPQVAWSTAASRTLP